jgi:hypothetical protein
VLFVHPGVGPLDERAVADATISALAAGGSGQAMMADLWLRGDTPRVVGREPLTTPAGETPPPQVLRR